MDFLPAMTLEAFRAQHAPALRETGGGCTALALDFPRGYMLITDGDGAAPEADSATMVCGLYAKDGDEISITEAATWPEISSLAFGLKVVARQIVGRALPETIAEYFFERLGRESTDATLADLPLESTCGDSCRAAIDAAAAHINHLRASGGAEIFGEAIEAAVAACDHAVQIYWRG